PRHRPAARRTRCQRRDPPVAQRRTGGDFMTVPVALESRRSLPLRRRLLPLLAVGIARPLARLKPVRLRAVLELARRGALPATAEHTRNARDEVVSVSLRCAGNHCLQRSIATVLLCRARGTWPTWCTG